MLYNIIKQLQNANGSTQKLRVLEENKNNQILKEYLRRVYDPSISYYQTKLPKYKKSLSHTDSLIEGRLEDLDKLSKRVVTGNAAIEYLQSLLNRDSMEGQELLELLIKRSIGASVGDTMILKVFPDLYFIPPYQRCSLMDAKVKDRFSKLGTFLVQEKLDGSFCYLVKEAGKAPEAITRAGSKYPTEFAEKLAIPSCEGFVVIGELVVYDCSEDEEGILLDRKTGNGILNSILKGGDIDSNLEFVLVAWDCVNVFEFKQGFSKDPYHKRLDMLELVWETSIHTHYVKSLEQAYQIYSKFTSEGKEGAVIKSTDFLWKDGTSKDCIKLKIEFEVDLEVVAIHEGTGKAKNMMGSLTLKSSDGIIVTDCGSGFSDTDRIDWWLNSEECIGSIVTVKANDIISKRDSEVKSLFLPIYLEHRLDKTIADSYHRCIQQLETAKNGGIK